MPRFIRLWLPVAAWAGVLYLASGRSSLPSPGGGWDKIQHVAAYAVLGVLSLRAFHGGLSRLRAGAVLGAALFTVGYGALDEFHQSFVPGRHPSLGDLAADGAGAVVAVLLVAVWRGRRPGRPQT